METRHDRDGDHNDAHHRARLLIRHAPVVASAAAVTAGAVTAAIAARPETSAAMLAAGGAVGAAVLVAVALAATRRGTSEPVPALHQQVVDHIQTAILVARPDRARSEALTVVAANPAAAQLFRRTDADLPGARLSELLGGVEDSVMQRTRAVADGGSGFTVERLEAVGPDPEKHFSLQVFPLPGAAVGLALDDVTGAAMVAAALRRQALHDGLTGLPNRTLLRDRLRFTLADARRRQEGLALILLDLDRFKEVNDTLGHQYGDRLLTAFAKRLQELLRECDTIARLGGDEFALLLTRATDEGAIRVVQKVTDAMQEPFELDGVTVQTAASLGVALYPDHAEDAEELTQQADAAMYAAKGGGGGWRVYSPAQGESSAERLTLLSDLHEDLEGENEPAAMSLQYQPLLDLATEEVVCAEALLRWEHPTLGWLDPETVVETAALSGVVGKLTRLATRQALRTAASWRHQGLDLTVAVNLSSRNLYDRTLTGWLATALDEAGLPPATLRCELTETGVTDDPVLAMDMISELRDLGIATTVDRFGTGSSSLTHLRRLPVDEIKIDPSFVRTMTQNPDDRAVVRTIIHLAHDLDKRVAAEGIDDVDTLAALRDLGCDRGQGDLIGRPVTGEEVAVSVMGSRSAGGS